MLFNILEQGQKDDKTHKGFYRSIPFPSWLTMLSFEVCKEMNVLKFLGKKLCTDVEIASSRFSVTQLKNKCCWSQQNAAE